MSYPGKMRCDGLCDPPVLSIPARQLLGSVCRYGGADCPLFESRQEALAILEKVKADPALLIRLTSDADRIPHYTMLDEADYANLDREALFNRHRDMVVLQRMGLVPGDTRRSRYLYELLLERIETPDGICAFDTPNWEGCPLARSGAYEEARKSGAQEIVFDRSDESKAAMRRESAARMRNDPVLKIRPHHLMCMSCRVGNTGGAGTGLNDTLDELYRRICNDPDVKIMLVEGNCEACWCCDGYHPQTTRCVHACGHIRDYLKDTKVFQALGVLPGVVMNARKLLDLIYERIHSTSDICGYGAVEATSRDWAICGSVRTKGFIKAREMWATNGFCSE